LTNPPAGVSDRRPLPSYVLGIEGTEQGGSKFVPGPALYVNGMEILHLDSSGRFDLRLTRRVVREMRDRLEATGLVRFGRSSSSDWVEVECAGRGDEALLVELLERAVGAHLAVEGAERQRSRR
jgi:hypothetical protein